MLEFAFFHLQPNQLFCDFLTKKSVPFQKSEDEGVFSIKISLDTNETLLEEIESQYDILLDMNQTLFENEQLEDNKEYTAAGVIVSLKDGRTVYANIDAPLLTKVMSALSPIELGEFVNCIVDAVENPEQRMPCERQRHS